MLAKRSPSASTSNSLSLTGTACLQSGQKSIDALNCSNCFLPTLWLLIAHCFPLIALYSASILSSAILAHFFSSSGTMIWLTTLPCTRFSSIQHKCWGSILYMVEQRHTVVDRKNIVLSGCSFLSRFTRLISVPIAHVVPEGAAFTVLIIYSVDPHRSDSSTTSLRHSG